ncbi:MAG: DUF1476 domain-containing protein [Rhodospirillaceae bacterium]|nr:MAG: DUF1476 domain-containing protein [Rhodospirillaceae bacterium]
MTNAFQDREKGFERKFELDQELAFRIKAHRDRLFGLWVAAQIGKSGTAAEVYASELIATNFEHPGDDDMLDKVRADLRFQNMFVEDRNILRQLRKAEAESARDVLGPDV